jgi:hypothetical protein
MARGQLGNLVVSDQHEQTLHVRDQFSVGLIVVLLTFPAICRKPVWNQCTPLMFEECCGLIEQGCGEGNESTGLARDNGYPLRKCP